jgi:hypothetical protein
MFLRNAETSGAPVDCSNSVLSQTTLTSLEIFNCVRFLSFSCFVASQTARLARQSILHRRYVERTHDIDPVEQLIKVGGSAQPPQHLAFKEGVEVDYTPTTT